MLLNRASQRSRAEVGCEALVEKELDRRVLPFNRPLFRSQSATTECLPKFLLKNCTHDFPTQRIKDNDIVESVDKFPSKRPVDGLHYVV